MRRLCLIYLRCAGLDPPLDRRLYIGLHHPFIANAASDSDSMQALFSHLQHACFSALASPVMGRACRCATRKAMDGPSDDVSFCPGISGFLRPPPRFSRRPLLGLVEEVETCHCVSTSLAKVTNVRVSRSIFAITFVNFLNLKVAEGLLRVPTFRSAGASKGTRWATAICMTLPDKMEEASSMAVWRRVGQRLM